MAHAWGSVRATQALVERRIAHCESPSNIKCRVAFGGIIGLIPGGSLSASIASGEGINGGFGTRGGTGGNRNAYLRAP